MKTLIIFLLFSLTASAASDFMVCTTLAGLDDNENEMRCKETTNMEEARQEFRQMEKYKQFAEKTYSKKLYPREHATTFLPPEE